MYTLPFDLDILVIHIILFSEQNLFTILENLPMDKAIVINTYRLLLQQLLANQEATMKELASIVKDAPGSNVTRSDTSRFQYGNQHLGQQILVEVTREYINSLKDAEYSHGSVRAGALVCIEDEEGVSSWFLLLKKANAQVVNIDEIDVTVISLEAPLSQVLISKKIDDEIEFRGRFFTVTDVL